MNRNTESRFSLNPTNLEISRSRFDRSSVIKTSFNIGELIPFYVDEVLPGDTFSVKTSKVVRMPALKTPIMDNVFLDTYYFFVPCRLVWEHWREFMGENTESEWIPSVEYEIPQLQAPEDGWEVGTIADYFGVPTGVGDIKVNALPFRAYALICNEWFRDQNLMKPVVINNGDSLATGSNGDNYIIDTQLGGKPFVAAKYHDYFTSALPAPQKGPDVTIPIADAGNLPVVPLDERIDPSYFVDKDYTVYMPGATTINQFGTMNAKSGSGDDPKLAAMDWRTSQGSTSGAMKWYFDNLYAVQDGEALAATINQLRLAFQIQRLYEKDARGGTRYIELVKSHFGVTAPDYRMQRPEYLGGNRIPITINQVVQQSATDENSPQGNVAGMSLTTDVNGDFTKSFTEHGYLIGLMVARYQHTYQQGLNRMWTRKDRFDFYWPVLANIGEQAIYNKEIYLQEDTQVNPISGKPYNDEVFGYQEAWAEYRYKPSIVTGQMRSEYDQSLDVWHLADDYEKMPTLSAEWIQEDKSNLDRVIAVTSELAHQLFADIYVANRTTRPMPMYSIPGLIDHH
jgi:hypothetical protein